VFADETKTPVFSNEVDVQTLVSSPMFRRAADALQIFKVYSPAPFVWRISCKVVLGSRRPLADSRDVLSDLDGQRTDMISVPRTILICGT
jgi:hypothetical protein